MSPIVEHDYLQKYLILYKLKYIFSTCEFYKFCYSCVHHFSSIMNHIFTLNIFFYFVYFLVFNLFETLLRFSMSS